MPLALVIVAALLFVTAVKGNYQAVGTQFNSTFFGDGSNKGFLVWFGSILGLAIVFRIINAPKAGELFIGLLILVYFLENTSALSSLESAIQGAGAAQTSSTSSGTSSSGSSSSTGSVSSSSGTTTTSVPAGTPLTGNGL